MRFCFWNIGSVYLTPVCKISHPFQGALRSKSQVLIVNFTGVIQTKVGGMVSFGSYNFKGQFMSI